MPGIQFGWKQLLFRKTPSPHLLERAGYYPFVYLSLRQHDAIPEQLSTLRSFSLLFLAVLACGSSLSLPQPLALPTTRCGRATAGFGPQASLARAPLAQTEPDPDVHQLSDGSFYNERLRASNVWEVDLPSDLVDEAADLFYGGRVALSEMVQGQHEPYGDMATAAGTFFCQKVTSWNSDLLWVSVDDHAAFATFEELFQRMRLPEKFASVVPHRAVLRLYSAFFVVRSRCDAPSWHTDYWPPVGTDALTLITPLRDFDETDSFQLRYQSHQQPAARSGGGGEEAGASAAPREERRYAYQKGRAIVFGSRFEHSTEVGSGRDGQVHLTQP